MLLLPSAMKNLIPRIKGVSQAQKIQRSCTATKLLSSSCTVLSIGQMLFFHNFPSAVIGIAGLVISHDFYVIADNTEAVVHNLFKIFAAKTSKSYVIQQLSKKTILPIWPSIIDITLKSL